MKERTSIFINLPTGFGKSLLYQALPPLFALSRCQSGVTSGVSFEEIGEKWRNWTFQVQVSLEVPQEFLSRKKTRR